MRILVVGRRWIPGRWVRAVASVLSVAVLLAVPALALAHLGSASLSFWTADDKSNATALPEGLLPFDAPAATVSMHQAITEDARQALVAPKSDDEVTVVRKWMYTQNIDAVLAATRQSGGAAAQGGAAPIVAPSLVAVAPILFDWWIFFNTGGATPSAQFSNILGYEFTYDLLVAGSVSTPRLEGIILAEYLYNQLFLQRSTPANSGSPST
jgi:hypothetical protein